MLLQRRWVEREVRRADHRHRIGTGLGCVGCESRGLRGRLRPAVDRDREPARGGTDEELGHPPPLVCREQDSLAGRPERQDPVDAAVGEETDIRLDRALVERSSPVPERRQRRSECSLDHARSIRSRLS